MVEIYVSWCKGLPENKIALEILRDSGIIDGVETSEYQDIDKIHSEGLKANIHRPFRDRNFNLEDKNIPEYTLEEIKEYNKSGSSILGFHLINHKKELEKDKEKVLINIKKNIGELGKIFEKDIVFEFSPYGKEIVDLRGKKNAKYFTSKNVAEDLLKNTSAGFLLDISHVFVSGMNKIKEGLFEGNIDDYFEEILSVAKDKVWQLHINVPIKKGSDYEDGHKTFEEDDMSKKIIQILKSILSECKNLKVITLEADTDLSPIEHSKKMVQQIEKLNKLLNIKREVKIPLRNDKI